MIRIGLLEPRIPQNTGNIGRTCLAFNCALDLIHPLGFSLDDKYLLRAGLDYWKHINLLTHKSFEHYLKYNDQSRIIAFSKAGDISIEDIKFKKNDCLLFGREDLGLPNNIKGKVDIISKIVMPGISSDLNQNGVRSLNLSVSVGIAIYKAYSYIEKDNF